jgi:hypothetical protein
MHAHTDSSKTIMPPFVGIKIMFLISKQCSKPYTKTTNGVSYNKYYKEIYLSLLLLKIQCNNLDFQSNMVLKVQT